MHVDLKGIVAPQNKIELLSGVIRSIIDVDKEVKSNNYNICRDLDDKYTLIMDYKIKDESILTKNLCINEILYVSPIENIMPETFFLRGEYVIYKHSYDQLTYKKLYGNAYLINDNIDEFTGSLYDLMGACSDNFYFVMDHFNNLYDE